MSKRSFILAHDLGTTGNKATLFDSSGASVVTQFAAYETAYPRPNWAEQDPDDWWRAVRETTCDLMAAASIEPGEIAVVSFSGMMNGALPVASNGRPLRPAIIWADQRATDEAAFLADTIGVEQIYRVTGHRPGAAYTAAKILWLRRHQPDIYAATHQFLQAKDYAAFCLSGVFATDYSDASSTNLFDLDRLIWAPEIFEATGLDPHKMPPVYPSTAVIGHVSPAAAEETGLLAGTPVVIGGGDGACAGVGAGTVRPGAAFNYLGSSSWIAVTAERPLYDPQMRTFTFVHLDPELYLPTGTMQSAGGAFDWLERLLRDPAEPQQYQALMATASEIEPGAGGLLFLPYLMGERSPHWNPNARGVFAGLTMTHGRGHLVRAVLEGVAFNLKMILETFQEQGATIREMRLIGGGARGALWRQILADIYGLPITLPQLLAEATSLGAAIAGGVGVGLFPDFSIAQELVQIQAAEQPDPATQERYARLYDLFRGTYSTLEPLFEELTTVNGQP